MYSSAGRLSCVYNMEMLLKIRNWLACQQLTCQPNEDIKATAYNGEQTGLLACSHQLELFKK